MLWTRFGSPTENYDSGTEEEIEIMLREGKQVFLYISKRAVNLDDVDYSQYERVKSFKDKYKNKGIYCEYNTIEEFTKSLYNHLCNYFSKDIKKDENFYSQSNLLIKVSDGKNLIDNILFYNTNYANSEVFSSLIRQISEDIIHINNINLPEEVEEEDNSTPSFQGSIKLKDVNLNPLFSSKNYLLRPKKVIISEQDKKSIENFVDKYNLKKLSNNFFELGNLRNEISVNLMGRTFYKPVGTDEEEDKYRKICDLLFKIELFEQLKEYLSNIDRYKKIWFVLANEGDHFDEDITINLYIPKGKVIMKEDINEPSTVTLDILKSSISALFKPPVSHILKEYPDYLIINNFRIDNPLMSAEDKYNQELEEFWDELEKIFVYEVFHSEECDIIQFNQSYLKQHSYTNFPTFICLKDSIDEIRYEIISKYCNKKVEGILRTK